MIKHFDEQLKRQFLCVFDNPDIMNVIIDAEKKCDLFVEYCIVRHNEQFNGLAREHVNNIVNSIYFNN